MNIKGLRKHKIRMERTEPIFKGNPVLALGLCLPFAIVPSLTLKNGLLLSALMLISTVIPVTAYSLMGKKIKKEIKVCLSSILSMALVSICIYYTSTSLASFYETIGVYAMLFGVNGLIVYCEIKAEDMSVVESALFSFKACIGFSVVVCFVSLVREFFALRTIFEYPVEIIPIKLDGIAIPFFGFITLGFTSAFFRNFERRMKKRIIIKNMKLNNKNEVNPNAK